jgi:hypothetical protein
MGYHLQSKSGGRAVDLPYIIATRNYSWAIPQPNDILSNLFRVLSEQIVITQ